MERDSRKTSFWQLPFESLMWDNPYNIFCGILVSLFWTSDEVTLESFNVLLSQKHFKKTENTFFSFDLDMA